MATEQEIIQLTVDDVIRKYKTSTITFYPYVTGVTDIYKQTTKTFGTPVVLVGRAILNPTHEQVTEIGSGEEYDIAFLFSKVEMDYKFPSETEGEWLGITGEITWWNRRFKIEKVAPTGQVGDTFSIVVVMGKTIQGSRD